jgi:hypothetical protein
MGSDNSALSFSGVVNINDLRRLAAEHRMLEAAPPYLRVAIVLLVQTGGRT